MKRSNLLLAMGVLAAGLLVILSVSRALYRPIPGFSQSAVVRATDQEGNVWLLQTASSPRVASTDPNGPKAGPPVIVKTEVYPAGREVSIGLVLQGQAGERYRPPTKNGMTVEAPKLKIVNEAGQVIADGNFQYG